MQLSVDKVNNKALLEKRPAINQHICRRQEKRLTGTMVGIWVGRNLIKITL